MVSVALLPTISAGNASALSYAATSLIDRFIADGADVDSSRNQSDQTAVADNTNVIVDSTSVTDLVGLGAAFAGLNQQSGNNEQSDSFTVTMTGATLARILSGNAPTDPNFIDNRGGLLRSIAFTAGYDRPEDGDLAPAKRFGVKWRLYADASTPGWVEGGKFLPAQVLAAPSTALLRPDVFFGQAANADAVRAERTGFGLSNQSENQQISNLLGAYGGATQVAVPAKNPLANSTPRAWAASVCQTPSAGAAPAPIVAAAGGASAKTRVSELFPPDTGAARSGRSRIGNAFYRSEKYVKNLVCDPTNGLVKLVRSEASAKSSVDQLLTAWDGAPAGTDQEREDRLTVMIDAAWSATVRGANRTDVKEQPEGGVTLKSAVANKKAKSTEALEKLEQLLRTKAVDNKSTGLTTFGEAVVLWAIGDTSKAIEKLKVYIAALGMDGSDVKRDAKNIAAMRKAAAELVDEVNKRTEFAIQFDTKLREGGDDEYLGRLNFRFSPLNDCGSFGWLNRRGIGSCEYWRHLDVSLNGGFDYLQREQAEDSVGGLIALAVEIPVQFGAILPSGRFSPSLLERSSMLEISGRAKWLEDAQDQFIGQVKLEIPIAEGISVPISASVANRREFIDETEVRGTLGFSVDTARILSALTSGAGQGLIPSP